jgi:hypothetical protein
VLTLSRRPAPRTLRTLETTETRSANEATRERLLACARLMLCVVVALASGAARE